MWRELKSLRGTFATFTIRPQDSGWNEALSHSEGRQILSPIIMSLHQYFVLDQECNFQENEIVISTNFALIYKCLSAHELYWFRGNKTKRSSTTASSCIIHWTRLELVWKYFLTDLEVCVERIFCLQYHLFLSIPSFLFCPHVHKALACLAENCCHLATVHPREEILC